MNEKDFGTRPLLICVPSPSGQSAQYLDLASELNQDFDLVSLHARGWTPGEQAFQSWPEMLETYANALGPLVGRRPYSILGYCHGGFVAQALSARFDAIGRPPTRVVLGDSIVPDQVKRVFGSDFRQDDQRTQLQSMVLHTANRFGASPDLPGRIAEYFDSDLVLDQALEDLCRMLFQDPGVKRAFRGNATSHHTILKWFQMFIHYTRILMSVPSPHKHDRQTLVLRCKETASIIEDCGLSWQPYCGHINEVVVEAPHETLFIKPNVGVAAKVMTSWLQGN
jgi:thioesterase domain-containing protein